LSLFLDIYKKQTHLMRKVISFESFIQENKDVNEAIDPITLLFAAGFIGYTVGADIIKAYREKKVLNSESEDIRKAIGKLQSKKARARSQGKKIKADQIQKQIDLYQEKLDSNKNRAKVYNDRIEDYIENDSLRKSIEDKFKEKAGKGKIRSAISAGKKLSKKL